MPPSPPADAGAGDTFARVALAVAVVANGTFGVTHKLCLCPNEAFTLYHLIGNALITLLTIPILPLLHREIAFAPLAIVSGLCQMIAIQFVFRAIEIAGVALATVGFGASVILLSVSGDIIVFGVEPEQPLVLCLALVLITIGLAGAGFAQHRAKKLRGSVTSPRASASLSAPGSNALSPGSLPGAHGRPSFRSRSYSSSSLAAVLEENLYEDEVVPEVDHEQLASGGSMANVQMARVGSTLQRVLSRADTRAFLQESLDSMVATPVSRVAWVAELITCSLVIAACVFAANAMELHSDAALQGVAYAWSFGVGMLLWAPLLPFIFRVSHGRMPRKGDFGTRTDMGFGLACGAIWGLANVGVNIAIGEGVEEGTALSIFQCSVFIAGLWGIVLGELRGVVPIVLFFVACIVFIAGVVAQLIST